MKVKVSFKLGQSSDNFTTLHTTLKARRLNMANFLVFSLSELFNYSEKVMERKKIIKFYFQYLDLTMFNTMTSTLLLLLVTTSLVSAGFRCSLGNFACSASCVTLGQTSGICDNEGECQCSERSIRSVQSLSEWSPYSQGSGPRSC